MKNLVIDILIKLSKVEVEAKEVLAQTEAQSLILSAVVLTLDKSDANDIYQNIHNAINEAITENSEFLQSDIDLVINHVERILSTPKTDEIEANPTLSSRQLSQQNGDVSPSFGGEPTNS